ncbi:PIR Superfamily Protein [Plasmodium ovale wallikeri]|uniref:PIR Superfamily Protein n=1 Tax=Plasmodium ovale wallikeri TaxID=864142 RepID=A0A1A9AM92_PLAOA|nr:PIR Superfamily Protein [Plasmodium ovale wallikeri]
MSQNVKLSDLPSKKFDSLKKRINYDSLQSYYGSEKLNEQIISWIDEFIQKIDIYLTEQSSKELIREYKGCKDFNYIIEEIKEKIRSLVNDFSQQVFLIDKIRNWHDNYPKSNPWYECHKRNAYNDHDVKTLYDICEDKIFIEKKHSDIEHSIECKSIFGDISKRKLELISKKGKLQRQIQHLHIPDVSCDPKILDSSFPSFTCTPSSKTLSESGEHDERSSHTDSGESTEMFLTQPLPSFGGSYVGKQESLAVTKDETSSDSSSNTIGLVSLPIFGVLALSLVLYRYTPLGSKFHASFRNNEDISINKDYEATNEMLSNISKYDDLYSENMQYNVSYQTL